MRWTPAFALLFAVPAAIAQEAAIRILRVPDHLRLPAPGGANLLLEVEVAGPATAVWVGSDRVSQDRLPLVPVGGNRHQANLADARLSHMLPAGRDEGSLFVFATIGDRTVQSAPIDWARGQDDGAVRCVVRSQGARTQPAAPERPLWIDPRCLERIEIQGTTARQASAVARLQDAEVPLVRGNSGTWTLQADGLVRERLDAATSFEVELKLGSASTLFVFRCIPARLDLESVQQPLCVQQRRKAALPGSHGWLEVRIDDITRASVLLTIVAADGTEVVPQRLVHERDDVPFELADGRYALRVKRLVNLLVGDDHAEFTVHEAQGLQPDRIGQLLEAIAASKDTFVREGKDHGGAEAATFLRLKLAAREGSEPDVDDFVERIASTSSRTGDDYRVRTADGAETTMREWLRARLRELEAQPPAK
jgi:hypothetical protein